MSTAQRSMIDDIRDNLGKMGAQFRACFPTQGHVDRFLRVVMTAVQQNPDLTQQDLRTSFYAACMRCAQDGLMPDGKQAALIPYGGTVNYQPMVEGLMQKLRNSGEIIGAPKVHVWKLNDEFSYELGDAERIIHKPKIGDRGETVGAYSIVKLKSGDVSREVMSKAEIDAIRKRSKAGGSGPWTSDYDEMARKTVFRRHYKKLPKSTDLDNVLAADDETFVPFEQPQQRAPLALPARAGGEPVPEQPIRSDALNKVVNGGGAAAATSQAEAGAAAADKKDIL